MWHVNFTITVPACGLVLINAHSRYSADFQVRYEIFKYWKISNISGTKSQNLNDSCLVLQLSLPNPLKLGVKSRMKM